MESTASHQTLPERSRERNGRSPTAWQIELIDQVVWCSSAMRTSEPQKKAVSIPCQLQVTRPPTAAGSSRETSTR